MMSMPLGLQGWEDRYAAMDLLFGEYDRILPDLHALTDQRVAHAIRKAVLGMRTDYLPRAKREIEKDLRALENRQGVDWLARQRSISGEILETQGRNLKILAGNLRKLHPEPEETPKDTWTAVQLKTIVDSFFRDKVTHCPEDGAQLLVEPDMMGGHRIASIFCPNCQRKADGI